MKASASAGPKARELVKILGIASSGVSVSDPLIKRVRVCAPQGCRNDYPTASALTTPPLYFLHDRASDASAANPLVDHKQRELGERRLVIESVPNVDGRQRHDRTVLRELRDDRARVVVLREARKPPGHDFGCGGMAELRGEAGERVCIVRGRNAQADLAVPAHPSGRRPRCA